MACDSHGEECGMTPNFAAPWFQKADPHHAPWLPLQSSSAATCGTSLKADELSAAKAFLKCQRYFLK